MELIEMMERGATLVKYNSGNGEIHYLGEVVSLSRECINEVIKQPQVKHVVRGIYVIPHNW